MSIPLGTLTVVTGVSGSGKSTLVDDILYRALAAGLGRKTPAPGRHRALEGAAAVDKVVAIDQRPIGRTPRCNPATYTGALVAIRELFSLVPEARARGYAAGRFSFNVKGGRCEACQGDGVRPIRMHFLPDVYVRCEACKGRRYNRETLEILYRGRTIADVLDMTVDEAQGVLGAHPRLRRLLATLMDVGLGYLRLGQSATTLSGGEAQRVKLARELGRRDTGRTLYILDEPTTGLHFDDVARLLHVLARLVDAGNTVVVVEHNLDVIKCADHVIDLGPEAGAGGGRVVACGTPEEVARSAAQPHRALPARRAARRSRRAPRDTAARATPNEPRRIHSGARKTSRSSAGGASSPSSTAPPTWSATRWGPCPARWPRSSPPTPTSGPSGACGRGPRAGGRCRSRWATRSDASSAPPRARSSCTRTSPSASP